MGQNKGKDKSEPVKAVKDIAGNRVLIGIVVVAILAVAVWLLYANVFQPNQRYGEAVALQSEGKYDEAIAAFEALDGYRDSDAQILETNYLRASDLLADGRYEDAIAAFGALGDYSDSAAKLDEAETKILDLA